MATIIGKKFGKHKLRLKFMNEEKSVEGTSAMVIATFVFTLASLLIFSAMPWYNCMVLALMVAPVCAVAELYTPSGFDALSVPSVACITMCVSIFM